jgi:hypothetical protein
LTHSLAQDEAFQSWRSKRAQPKIAGLKNSDSLVHNDVIANHFKLLESELKARAKVLGCSAQKRTRCITVLNELVDMDIEQIEEAVVAMEARFKSLLNSCKPWSRGTIELELINLDLLERFSDARDDQARKMNVLISLGKKTDFDGLRISADKSICRALAHCHVLLELGKKVITGEELIRSKLSHHTSGKEAVIRLRSRNSLGGKAWPRIWRTSQSMASKAAMKNCASKLA